MKILQDDNLLKLFSYDFLESLERELLGTFDAGIFHGEGGFGGEALYGLDEFCFGCLRREENPCFLIYDCFPDSSFIDSYDRNSACHGLERHHPKVFILCDEYRSNGSGDIFRKIIVIGEREKSDILASF